MMNLVHSHTQYLLLQICSPLLYETKNKPASRRIGHLHHLQLDASVVPRASGGGKTKRVQCLTTTKEDPAAALTIAMNTGGCTLRSVKTYATELTNFSCEIEDLKGSYVEFSKDQYGSRFLQKELEVVDSDTIQLVFEEVMPVICNLITDVYGNYVVQKFFDFGTDDQKAILASKLRGNVVAFSLHLYGCRVVQKALETLPGYLQVGNHKCHALCRDFRNAVSKALGHLNIP